MLHDAEIKDAVTAYEVYREKAVNEVRKSHGDQLLAGRKGRSPDWQDLVKAYHGLRDHHTLEREPATDGGDLLTPDADRIGKIRNLRHVLTHRRGELRTEEDRKAFGRSDDELGDKVRLDESVITTILADLDSSVRAVDPLIWSLAWKRTKPRTRAPHSPALPLRP